MNKRVGKPVRKQTGKQKSSSAKQQHPIQQLAGSRLETDSIHNYQQAADGSPQAQQIAQFQKAANDRAAQHTSVTGKDHQTGLPDSLKAGIEDLSGYSLNDVKVHYNSGKPAQLQAHAYAQGAEIHVAPGQEKHLPHEAWHVVQQKQGRVKPTTQLQEKVPVNDDQSLEKEADVMGAKAVQFKWSDHPVNQEQKISGVVNQSGHPVQRVKFDRFMSFLYYNSAEDKLIEKEKDVNAFFLEMQPYAPRFPEITTLGQELAVLKNKTIKSTEIKETSKELKVIQEKLDLIASKITLVGVKGDQDMMLAYGKNTKDSNVGKMIQYYLDTIGFLPSYMDSEGNRKVILHTIHPDVKSVDAGYDNQNLQESDLVLAQKRHIELVRNILNLDELLKKDWKDLQQKFGLKGALKKVSFTGSDLHHGAEQVVIIESAGGQKVVYKPRSVAPDKALLDTENGAFAKLNKKGANLPTMKFHTSKTKGSYVEFIQQQRLKTTGEIQDYYFKMGQLAVAAKLFGVNDLHYENIMAAANGPNIIDGETSFLTSVMTTRDFRSNELQMGVFEHISAIDQKLSNNAFYTAQEEQNWKNLEKDENGNPGFDKYIGKIRKKDVKAGGTYEADLKRGIAHLVNLIRVNRKGIQNDTTSAILSTDQVRVVPIGTNDFKSCMRSYRGHKRHQSEKGLNGSVKSAEFDVVKSLYEKGYTLYRVKQINQLIREDFEAGNIPILHYNGSKNQLVWNERVIGKRPDPKNTKKVVNQNVKWILMQTVDQITTSVQQIDDV